MTEFVWTTLLEAVIILFLWLMTQVMGPTDKKTKRVLFILGFTVWRAGSTGFLLAEWIMS